MKQLKFLMNVSCEGNPIWYKGHIYEVLSEGESTQGRPMYKLICEDLKVRGIDALLSDKMYTIVECNKGENKIELDNGGKSPKVKECRKEEINIIEQKDMRKKNRKNKKIEP